MNKLKELRKKYNLTQQELAGILSINQHHISLWENNLIKLNSLKMMGIKKILEDKFDIISNDK